ncbi:TonB-dependent receptor [Neolewinella antarctica]|uniref:TonB-dependent receptor n=1 Tax=Neolewinella antarctica TaxID=442734 RepID=A0ABX0X6Y7_9BACT|nr:carboxypeptidase regulatory-like domain-containing protein [Neolewinella antarctica]NJC24990.1 hypothetical protein [Neolewinella antarctica]
MKHLLPLLLLLCGTPLFAQVEIVGTVIDSTGTTLPGANAILLRSSDSLLTAFGTTDDKGVFRMQDVPTGDYLLRVSFIGFERPDMPLKLTSDDQYLGLGEIKLYPAGFLLSGIEVTADRIPIRMKGDTMLYDAGAFGVSENAVVEDLLRRLPGMTVDASGQITWRGRPISEVMINGKPFFGGNTTLLTQNLDAKAVKNIQVYDQKTDTEEITGVDDGVENITVNLETKEEFKAKVFGDVYGGYGTGERYQAGGKGFRISDASQWGVLGTINNINRVGFSGDEISGFNGSSGRGRGSWWSNGGGGDEGLQRAGDASGENRSIAAGLNFGKTLGKDGQLTADYALFDRQQTQLTSSLQSFNRANDNRIISTDEVNGANSYRHSFGFELRQKLDTLGRIRVNGNLNLTGGDNTNNSNTVVKNTGRGGEEFTVNNISNVDQPNGRMNARYNTKLSTEVDRTLGVNANVGFSENQRDIDLATIGLSEDGNLAIPGALVNGRQTQTRLTNSLNYGGSIQYGEPLGDKWSLDGGVGYAIDDDEGDYRFNFNENTTKNLLERTWETFDTDLGFTYRFESGGNFDIGTNYKRADLALSGDVNSVRNFNYLLPYTSYSKRLEKGYFRAGLRSSVREPSIQQLQTIAEPSINGRVSVGNSSLTPAQSTNFQTFLWYNDQFRALSGNVNLNVGYTDNAFGNEVTFTEGQQIFRTINVSHAYSANFYLGGTIGMAFINGQTEMGFSTNYNQGQGFVDGLDRTNTNLTLSGNIDITTELNDDSYLTIGYDLTNLRNSFEDVETVTTMQTIHYLSADFALELNPVWRLETRFGYNIYAANDFSEQQTIADMRLGLEIRPFKKAGHYVKLTGSDLFDQNTVIDRNVGQFVTTETTSNSLGRYFLATFFYKL